MEVGLRARSWWASTAACRHTAPSPDGGTPQDKEAFFRQTKNSLDFVRKNAIFKRCVVCMCVYVYIFWKHLRFFAQILKSWPEFIVVVYSQYKSFRNYTLKLLQTRTFSSAALQPPCWMCTHLNISTSFCKCTSWSSMSYTASSISREIMILLSICRVRFVKRKTWKFFGKKNCPTVIGP